MLKKKNSNPWMIERATSSRTKEKPAYRPESSKQSNREAHYYKISQDRGYSSITQYTVYAGIV